MARADVFALIEAERASGRPFAVATVIRTAGATSAKAGAKAVIAEDGTLSGHLGGACVAGAVGRAAAEALASGMVSTIRIRPRAEIDRAVDDDGAVLHGSGCPSGGIVELLIEPYPPAPRLAVAGASPVAAAIARVGAAAGYRIARAAAAEDRPLTGPEGGRAVALDFAGLPLGAGDAVVVATQGRHDMVALRAALGSEAGHVAMVASRAKAASLCARLLAEGVAPDRLARLEAPAGPDLGGVEPEEIAVAVIAGVVRWRNRRRSGHAPPGAQG